MRHLCLLLAALGVVALPLRAQTLPPGVPPDRTILQPMVEAALWPGESGEPLRAVIERPGLPLGNPGAAPTELRLEGVRTDAAGRRFGAALVGTSEGRERFRLPVAGRLVRLIELPVPDRRIARGQAITAADLDWRTFEAPRVRRGAITEPETLIGKVARRTLQAARQISHRDVEEPQLVLRGRPVRLVFRSHGLRLATVGLAQEPGALGDLVRVLNADSREALTGVVSGPAEVQIGGAPEALP